MAKFTVVFSTNNAAFQDDFEGEVRSILEQVIATSGDGFGRLHDTNGNKVGYFAHGKTNQSRAQEGYGK